MKNIRIGIFETNSSSTHSISISSKINKKDMMDTIIPDDNGVIVLDGGEFGWTWEKFNDALTKANYCAVDKIRNEDKLEMLKEVIMEQTRAHDVQINISTDYYENSSYIDHQSHGTSTEAFESKETLRDFIFNPNSWLFIGNDNSYAPSNFHDTDPGIEYKYQLTIEGSDRVEKFIKKPSKQELEEAIIRIMESHEDCSYGYNYEDRFTFTPWDIKVYKKRKRRCSLEQISEKLITIFRKKSIYSEDSSRKWLGDDILEEKTIKFALKKI